MRRTNSRSSVGRRFGFTLIELVVTMTVFAILAVIAVPSFVDYVARSRLRSAAESLVNQLALARSEAVRLHRNVLVTFNTGVGTWCSGGRQYDPGGTVGITVADADATSCDCTTAAGQALCLVNGSPSLVTSVDHSAVEAVAVTTGTFQFDRNVGVIKNLGTGDMTLRSSTRPSRYELKIVVSPLGHARICVPAGFAAFGGFRPCSS